MYFDRAVEFVLRMEGGYSNISGDRGGETKWGISKHSHPDLDIKNLTVEDAKVIYRAEFWARIRGDEVFSWPVVLTLFDLAVNSGPLTAIAVLQQELGVLVDGDFGPKTLAALKAARADLLADRINDVRLRRYVFQGHVASQSEFLLGWLRRLMSVVKEGATQHV